MALSMDKDVAAKFEEFKKTVASAGEKIVFRVFPSKILELQSLIDGAEQSDSPFHASNALKHTDTNIYPPPSAASDNSEHQAKKRKREDAAEPTPAANGLASHANEPARCIYPNLIKSNKNMTQLHDIIRRESQELATNVDKTKLWVNLIMPRIEDGDNFGVQIQEEVLTELHRAQESAYSLRDAVRADHLTRAKICSKLIKYPHLEDYALALQDHDEKQHFLAKQHLTDIRNLYAILTDLIHKNITKIRAPKANNAANLY
ncbi:proteasome activator pa28 REG alpha/beta subunit [Pterulicium gracile]|uniref:Proteasome activator pa28 REG alpha/beta subunit n=1 Tax=Pterulicium gracile TaxID=1884261 RepID=A0A5C3QHJ4_9AGAR|nr:proteasome activator pa28 REG alpha/beta subunit [Pterula gracilis]